MRRLLFITVFLFTAAVLSSGGLRADQNDARLDSLFGNLQQTTSSNDAADYINQIWQIWTVHNDPDVNNQMDVDMLAMSRNDLTTALGVFSTIVNADPDFAEGWNKRATVYYLMGRVPESLQDVEATLLLEPRHFGALSGRGLLYSAAGDYRNALQAFEEAIGVNPFMPSIQQRIEMLKKKISETDI